MEILPQLINWSSLPQGFIIDDRYAVVRPLIKGSGGSVYLVEDLQQQQQKIKTSVNHQHSKKLISTHKSKLDSNSVNTNSSISPQEETKGNEQMEMSKTLMKVMKVYSSQPELELFQKEFNVLSDLNKTFAASGFRGPHPNIVATLDAKLISSKKNEITQESQIQERRAGVQTRSQLRKQRISDQKTAKKCSSLRSGTTAAEHEYVGLDAAYIVFEYCEKDDLFQYVKSGETRLQAKMCHSLFYQVLCGINFLHEQCDIAHMDIKLENLVVDSNFRIKLIDFAFCEPKNQDLKLSKGTAQYLAPEVLRTFENNRILRQEGQTRSRFDQGAGQSPSQAQIVQGDNQQQIHKTSKKSDQVAPKIFTYQGEKADVFSLGILLFTMYFGIMPFKINNPEDPMFQLLSSGNAILIEQFFNEHHLTKLINRIPGLIPQTLKNLLGKLLNANPVLRPTIHDILMKDEWMNDINNMSTVQQYVDAMQRIYLINHSLVDESSFNISVMNQESKGKQQQQQADNTQQDRDTQTSRYNQTHYQDESDHTTDIEMEDSIMHGQ
ncbi:protein kinase domain containing protein [Stylonychia lemnae]|uniref:non-specific serine/threonine protein kinase n=1 Tax=Stylonychia lemnae TaxID=5949 RepID=A0A078AWR7_STYLE|nr:protein kinase domain containing protein [Stylonychia lemnae]|eukprot:CDW85702.1 protein kinase domain containing protein [Stylonychia lemnae]